MGTMFDTTSDLGKTLGGLVVEAVAAYGNGRYANCAQARAAFPDAHVLEIDVTGQGIGEAGDFEPGDMSYSRAGSWARERIAAGVQRPVIYFSLSHWQEVMLSLRNAGLTRRDVRLWTAHYSGHPHLCSSACGFGVTGTADATQWGSADARGTLPGAYHGRNIDVSMTADDFWSATASRRPGTHPRLLRSGESGAAIVRVTRRLSLARSRASGRPYLDGPRSRFDAATAAALKRFQAEHHLRVDGIYGPESAQALRRAVRVERARRRDRPTSPVDQSRPPKLVALVTQYRRLDAEAAQAWKALTEYGARRTAAVADASAESTANLTLADIAVTLHRIEHGVGTLVEQGREHAPELPAEPAQPEPAVATATVLTGNSGDAAGPPPPTLAHRAVVLDDLTDHQLTGRADRLDAQLDAAREALITRYVAVERTLTHGPHSRQPGASPTGGAIVAQRPKRRPTAPVVKQVVPRASARELQQALNDFAGRFLKGFAPLAVDGKVGPATRQRIRAVKYYLGYRGHARGSVAVDARLMHRIHTPRSARYSNPAMLARASRRRRHQHKLTKRSAAHRAGTALFDGRPVAAWLEPYLLWARQQGWPGTLSSGWRDPEYSEHLCRQKCGAPKCAGTCAGRSSNHVGRIKPAGAIDVTHYAEFAALMRKCPHKPRIFNDLPADPVHFSATGH